MRVMLGDKARDRVTGFEGVVTQIVYILDDRTQVVIERADSSGKPEKEWFVEGRVDPA